MNDTTLLLGFPEYMAQTRALAEAAGLPCAEVALHRFPDGETRVRLPLDLPRRLVLCRALDHADDKLVSLILTAGAAREQDVESLILVAPYLCYMRQDTSFHPGEAVSQRIVGRLLAERFDGLLTVDAHLHRVHRLEQAVPVTRALNLTATEPMACFLAGRLDAPLLVGPDGESEQWVTAIARHERLEYRVARKQRLGDREVRITLPEGPYRGRHLVLVDDVASTGRTLEAAARALREQGPASLSVLVTHALFVDDAMARLRQAGVENIWSCDSIAHPTNAVALAPLLSGALGQLYAHARQSVNDIPTVAEMHSQNSEWQSEHASWKLDLEQWQREIHAAELLLFKIERALPATGRVMEEHRDAINDHDRLLREHEQRLKRVAAAPESEMSDDLVAEHRQQQQHHLNVQDVHSNLGSRHHKAIAEVRRLGALLGESFG